MSCVAGRAISPTGGPPRTARLATALKGAPENVVIDVTHAHLWDVSSVAALDAVVLDFRRLGSIVTVVGMNEATAAIVGTHGVHDKGGTLPLGH